MKLERSTYQKPLSMTGLGGGATSLSNAGGAGTLITDGLVQHIDFSKTNCYSGSGLNVYDLSGNSAYDLEFKNNTHTLHNSAYGSGGRHIEMPDFNSSNKLYRVGTGNNSTREGLQRGQGSNPYTVEFWINPCTEGANAGTLMSDMFTTFRSSPYDFRWHWFDLLIDYGQGNGGRLAYNGFTSAQNPDNSGSFSTYDLWADSSGHYFPDDQTTFTGWEYLAIVRENNGSNGLKFYRNASVIHTTTSGVYHNSFNQGGYVNMTYGPYELFRFKCKVGIYRRYHNKGFTSAEVQQHYDRDKGRFGLS